MDPVEKGQQPTTSGNATGDDQILEKTESRHQLQGTTSDEDSSSVHSENEVLQLIPQLTRRGTVNPDSPQFSTEKFLRDILARAKEQGLRRRNAGVLFRSLVVLGYGSDFTHQNTVGTVATGIFRIKDTLQAHRHPPMKTILYSMDGCIKEGEMLLVLGKPGSGATTLLKTIAGETRGYASISGGIYSYYGIYGADR
jgi:ATPase subunit of ABC transporter with duplicated ATPase domains